MGTGVALDRVQLPVAETAPRRPIEGEEGEPGGKAEGVGQVFVRSVFPSGAPDKLEVHGQGTQVLAGGGRKKVVDPLHRLEPAGWTGVRVEPV